MTIMVEPDLLASFVAVADAKSFTRAAERLGLRQSTVSQHIKRLEAQVARHLFARDTHAVALTPQGDALLDYARGILDAQDRFDRFVVGSELRGRLRFGASEDFVLSLLPDVLVEFGHQHPSVDLELTVGFSGTLYERYDDGDLDVIFAKRRRGDGRGQVAWREPLAWVGRPGFRPDPDLPLPLVLYPPPSVSRGLALAALDGAGRSWRLACTSGSLNGLRAAAMAGLGVTPHSTRLLPPGLVPLPPSRNVPELGHVEFVVIGAAAHRDAAAALTRIILATAGRADGRAASPPAV